MLFPISISFPLFSTRIDIARPYRWLSDSHSVIERDVSREHSQSRARYSVPQRTPISTFACRAVHYVRPLRVFALCIWQAPRPAATFGSFWSLQKEHAVGREFGERWFLDLVLILHCPSPPEAWSRGERSAPVAAVHIITLTSTHWVFDSS